MKEQKIFVVSVRRFARSVEMNVRNMRLNIAASAQKHVSAVRKNAGRWQPNEVRSTKYEVTKCADLRGNVMYDVRSTMYDSASL